MGNRYLIMSLKQSILTLALWWNYREEIEKLRRTPLYADGRYAQAVAEKKNLGKDSDTIAIAHKYFDPEYETLSFIKKAELLTNIDHLRVDTIAH